MAIEQSGDYRGGLLKIAQSAGMSEPQFDACISDDKSIQALNDRVETYAKRDNITGTPTFIVNGKVMDGEQSLATLTNAINAAQAASAQIAEIRQARGLPAAAPFGLQVLRQRGRPSSASNRSLTWGCRPHSLAAASRNLSLEALRWVMGANSAKAMRAGGMDDVIFAGSGDVPRPRCNHAEGAASDHRQRRPHRAGPVRRRAAGAGGGPPRIDRGQGSTFKVNGRELRAPRRATAVRRRPPPGPIRRLLVRQGIQISELIAARPQNRLDDRWKRRAGSRACIRGGTRPSCACAPPRPT